MWSNYFTCGHVYWELITKNFLDLVIVQLYVKCIRSCEYLAIINIGTQCMHINFAEHIRRRLLNSLITNYLHSINLGFIYVGYEGMHCNDKWVLNRVILYMEKKKQNNKNLISHSWIKGNWDWPGKTNKKKHWSHFPCAGIGISPRTRRTPLHLSPNVLRVWIKKPFNTGWVDISLFGEANHKVKSSMRHQCYKR